MIVKLIDYYTRATLFSGSVVAALDWMENNGYKYHHANGTRWIIIK